MGLCNIGEVIRTLRKKHKVTQQELAEVLNVSAQVISKWENGLAYPDVSYVPKLAGFFKVSISSLFTGAAQKDEGNNLHNGVVKTNRMAVAEHGWGEVFGQVTIDKLFGALPKVPAQGKRVLVVDDAAFMRNYISSILTGGGYEVVAQAANGIEAVSAVEAFSPDIVIMDIVMPELDGLNAMRQMKQKNENVVVVFCSSMASQQIILQAIDLGASWFMVKPFVPEQLMARMREM